jgi:hypothetical protein
MMDVRLTNVEPNAATDVLLAIEIYAERFYAHRASDPAEQKSYNDLAAIVLPLRAARDAELLKKSAL